VLILACSASRDRDNYMVENTSALLTTGMPRSSDDSSQRCFTSGMEVLDMYAYKPVSPLTTYLLTYLFIYLLTVLADC